MVRIFLLEKESKKSDWQMRKKLQDRKVSKRYHAETLFQ